MEWLTGIAEWITVPRGIVIGLSIGFVIAVVEILRDRGRSD